MEEASKAKKAKKGFMTPERKKKLRLLLRKKAAEELKKEQERKAAERRRIIEERCGKPKLVDDANEGTLKKICKDYYDRMYICEEQKWDLEREVRKRDWEISELNSQVNDLRGKFVKPTLKKVSKYENKFAKLQKKAAEFNFRNQLKVVKKKEFTLEEEDKEKKPDWSKKGDEKKEGEEEAPAAAPPAEGEAAPAPAEGEAPAEGAAPAPAEGQPTEGQPAEGGQTTEGAAPEGQPPAEGAPAEGEPPAEPEKEKTPEPPPETGFETFKKLVLNENYDIITLPETILAPTEDKEAVAIPNYSLVENRRGSGDGVIMYVKDSLKYKVVDLTAAATETEHAHLSFEDLLEKLKKNGHAAEAAALEAKACTTSRRSSSSRRSSTSRGRGNTSSGSGTS
ncbi:unnamed protein product [Diabrotica balteata]|uniref:Troponin I n=1 Tax=Diabrotica balteata TaxID=107213 RepID=A0A9N9XD41_DIABA|nr:unnamed protein product [Diabrotica balteata]